MQHHPKIVHLDAENLTNLFAAEAINFPHRKSTGRALRERRETIIKRAPKIILFDELRGVRVPVGGRMLSLPVAAPNI